MSQFGRFPNCVALGALLTSVAFGIPSGTWAKGAERVLYSFTGGDDGANPYSDLIQDKRGFIYGTARNGGAPGCSTGNGCGVIFKLAPSGNETVLHSFSGGSDGGNPYAGLQIDKKGDLFGDTLYGGEQFGTGGSGVIFKLTSVLAYTELYAFTGSTGEGNPRSVLISDKQGDLYGTASSGGVYSLGSIFKLTPDGTLTDLYDFTGGDDGATPAAGLVMDAKGNLYGTTEGNGTTNYGTIFKLKPDGRLLVLHVFTGQEDGGFPLAALIMDHGGNLYGTSSDGGQFGGGVVFEVTAREKYKKLYDFMYGDDGGAPCGSLTMDADENLYGTTSHGGSKDEGVVFKLTKDAKELVLHSFQGGKDGANPFAGLLMDNKGSLYGTTTQGGANNAGTVFVVDHKSVRSR